MRSLAALGIAAALLAGARASAEPAPKGDAIALLPLDADARLELYGQPVASEIARALVAGSVDVVVVGPKMAMPERARLIVDGTIAGRGEAVVLTVRVRNPIDGKVLATVAATAPTLANIDRAAADVSARVLPAVREQLAALNAPVPAPDEHRAPPAGAPAPRDPLVLVAVGARPAGEPLRAALAAAADAYVRAHRRASRTADAGAFAPKTAAQTVTAAEAQLALGFEVLGYDVTPGELPLARARVRVRFADATGIVFDRVVATDSVVGDRKLAPAALAARTAREVLDIVRPHLARAEPGWR